MTVTLAEQRRGLPDQPGVYLFRDGKGRVVYVGKAKSIRKRVASHFSKAQVGGRGANSPAHAEMVAAVEKIEFVVVGSEAEALLAEQSFIKQYRPRFNIRLRDDKSYPFIAISLDEDFPRVYFTRERHRPGRAYFGPYSNAKRVRGTLDLLTKIFMFRSCTGPEPGRRSGSPCLDYYIKRCEAPASGMSPRSDYRESIDGVIDFLSGRYRTIERDLQARMKAAAEAQEYEQATLERNRLRAVRSLLERQRVASDSIGTLDAVAVALDGTEANAQVFQVRDGVLSDRQSFYLSNEAERALPEVAEEFMLQYYAGHSSIPAQIVVQRELVPARVSRGPEAGDAGGAHPLPRAQRSPHSSPSPDFPAWTMGPQGWRPSPRLSPAAAAVPSSCAPPSAATSAGSSSWPSATRASRSTRSTCAPSAAARAASRRWRGLQQRARPRRAAGEDRVLRHLQPRRHPHGRLDGRARGRGAEEIRLPPLQDPHSGRRASPTTTRRWRRCWAAASPSGSARPTSPRTTPTTTRASRRCQTSW